MMRGCPRETERMRRRTESLRELLVLCQDAGNCAGATSRREKLSRAARFANRASPSDMLTQ